MRTIVAALLILLLASNLWALDSLGWWTTRFAEFSIIDAVGGLLTQSPASDGNLREMKVYLSVIGGGSYVKCGFYLWPDTTLVDSTEILTPPVDTGWVTFKFIDSATIYADSSYCLLITADYVDGVVSVWYNLTGDVGDDWARDLSRTYGAWPAVFNTIDNVNLYPVSIYATYEPTAAAAGQVIIINTQ